MSYDRSGRRANVSSLFYSHEGSNAHEWIYSVYQQFDRENGNNLWWEAIIKKMRNVRPAFEVWEKETSELPEGYQDEERSSRISSVGKGNI